MKYTLLLPFIFFFAFTHAQSCHEIPLDWTVVDGPDLGIGPGDTICLIPGIREIITIRDVFGTEDDPVVIINRDGEAIIHNTQGPFGMKLDSCRYIKITGSGVEGMFFGIKITEADGAGITLDNFTSDVELERLWIENSVIAGIYAKTDPNCFNKDYITDWTMYNINIHDCHLKNIGHEGMYIGSTKYIGGQQLICDGDTLFVTPHTIENVSVSHCTLDSIGWDGIQVSSTPVNCVINDNVVYYDSFVEWAGQMSGIISGGYSKCDIYNNKIMYGKGNGIEVHGVGDQKIFNNLIVESGLTYTGTDRKYGIFTKDQLIIPGWNVHIYNNTIVRPKSFGIYMLNDEQQHFIMNNIIAEPGEFPYIASIENVNYDTSHNYNVPFVEDVHFEDPESGDYHLKYPSSMAIDYGLNLSGAGITFDLDNNNRPFLDGFDAGAYEHPTMVDVQEVLNRDNGAILYDAYPNPTDSKVFIRFYLDNAEDIELRILDIQGRTLWKSQEKLYERGGHEKHVDIGSFTQGLYIYQMRTQDKIISKKLTVKK